MFVGVVYINGQEKVTKLPSLQKDSVLVFETEVLQKNKVRVTIEINEKIATFDWIFSEKPSQRPDALIGFGLHTQDDENLNLHFAMRFNNSGWKIAVH